LPRKFGAHSLGRKNPELTFNHNELHFLIETISKMWIRAPRLKRDFTSYGINRLRSIKKQPGLDLIGREVFVSGMSGQQINNSQADDQKGKNSACHAEKKGIAEKKNIQFRAAPIQSFKNAPCFKPGVHFTLDCPHF
jgi:hypothetical protein